MITKKIYIEYLKKKYESQTAVKVGV